MKILSKLDNTGMIEETADKRYVSDAEKSAWNGKADKTYVDNKVKTNVPSGAKFTDTVTTVNGKTGAITKADITALGIPAQDTVPDISGKADKTYVDNKVKTDVPAGAKFTDTVYTHPVSHPASMITGLPTSLPANGGNADTVGGFTVGTNVPANAKFTDTNTTYSEISTAEIDAGTASTGRAITGRRVKYILDKISSMISVAIGALTKSSVGLGNVDNTSDASKPISTATQAALDGKANKSQVLTNVPSGAKFTDTVYTHPSTHPASMITGLPTKLPADGGTSDLTKGMIGDDTRTINSPPSEYMSSGSRYLGRAGWQTEFKNTSTLGVTAYLSGTYCYLETKNPWSDSSGGYPIQLAYGNGTPLWRVGTSATAWSEWSPMNSGGDANTVSGYTVKTNVPANAKFTDTNTVTTINGKTGAISKADITALGIPAQDTKYTHPSSHPASMITESSTRRFVSDSEKSTWNSKPDTDTVTTINGKTGAISKADIVALGIPSQNTNTTYSEITTAEIDAGTSSTLRTLTGRRVKYILDKVQGWIGGLTKSDVGLGNVDNLSAASIRSGTTKADVGLGNVDNLSAASIRSGTTKANVGLSNVDNVKQMPISSGVLENHREKLVPVTAGGGAINLNLGNVFQHTPSGNRTYSITNAVNGEAHSFTLIINMGTTVRALTFPSSVKWQSGEVPDMSSPSRTYVLTFISVNGGTTWLGMFAGQLSLKGLMDYSYVSDTHVVKYGNGVMEQWKSAFPVGAPNTQRGSIYVTTDYTWNFPVAFAEIPTVVPTVRGGVGMTWAGLGNTVTTTTSTSLAGYSAVSSNGIISCSVHAIGRWK